MRSCHITNFWIGSGTFIGNSPGVSGLHAGVLIYCKLFQLPNYEILHSKLLFI